MSPEETETHPHRHSDSEEELDTNDPSEYHSKDEQNNIDDQHENPVNIHFSNTYYCIL